MRTSIWFVRHGQTQFNLERRYQSWSNSPLTAYGHRQSRAVALRLRRIPFDVALVSPAERTQRTAQEILAGRRGVTVRLDQNWAESHHGHWEGLTYREVLQQFPDEARARWSAGINGRAEGGESLAEVYARVAAAWRALLHDHPGGRILVVTHATPIQLVLCECFGLAPGSHWHWRIDPGSLTSLDAYAAGVILRMVNHVPPLPPVEA
ncbi:histidine phosphatase family protein [Candidatus Chloroploca sp. Khr17]|uniref:histidine phosphatase family protein n=1 Tax=Candidatus Chloroploca sp. Khr17 TaxID=2496869 RepID=UPI00101B9DBE|nr:histidine phosphatase family protein [Candidatus Chloroploca sp. Khr17]